jgi:hypothetical protein
MLPAARAEDEDLHAQILIGWVMIHG